MAEHVTLTIRADLRDRIQALAAERGQSTDEVLDAALPRLTSTPRHNWALAFVEAMESEDIEWIDDPDASVKSRERYEQHVYEKWLRTQQDASREDSDG